MEKKQMANLPSINGREMAGKWREIYLVPGRANRSNCIIPGEEAKRILRTSEIVEQVDILFFLPRSSFRLCPLPFPSNPFLSYIRIYISWIAFQIGIKRGEI